MQILIEIAAEPLEEAQVLQGRGVREGHARQRGQLRDWQSQPVQQIGSLQGSHGREHTMAAPKSRHHFWVGEQRITLPVKK